MHHSQADALSAPAKTRLRGAIALTAAILVPYFGFILLVAFNKPLMGRPVAPGLSLGILLGVLVILVAWALTGVYIVWANGKYDRALRQYTQR